MSSLSAGRIINGKYRLEKPLARGGMGSLWVAQHVTLGTQVALKFMAVSVIDEPAAQARFEREAKATAVLHSPHVVQVFDYGIDEEIPFIAMELLQGQDLGERLKQVRRFDPRTAATLLMQMAKGLGKAHEAGIIHRDLKPRNVFLARTEEGDLVKLLDFGIAKFTGEIGETKTGEVIGSPHFMSPEQAHGAKAVDHRSDLWSLGAILYRMLTGKNAFDGDGLGEIIMKLHTASARPPSTLNPELPKELDAFFEKVFQRDPTERFQSARELAMAFFAIVGEPSWSSTWSPQSHVSQAAIAPSPPSESSSMTPAPIHRATLGEPTLERTDNTSGQEKLGAPKRRTLGIMAGAITLVGVIVALLLVLRARPVVDPGVAAAGPEEAGKPALSPPASATPVVVAPAGTPTNDAPLEPAAPAVSASSAPASAQVDKSAAAVAPSSRPSSKQQAQAVPTSTSTTKKRPKLGY